MKRADVLERLISTKSKSEGGLDEDESLSLGEDAKVAKGVVRSPKEYFDEDEGDVEDELIAIDVADAIDADDDVDANGYVESTLRAAGDGEQSDDEVEAIFSKDELKVGPLAERVAQILSTGSLYGSQTPFLVNFDVAASLISQLEGLGRGITVVDFHGYHCSKGDAREKWGLVSPPPAPTRLC